MEVAWPHVVGALLLVPGAGAAQLPLSGVGGIHIAEHRVDAGFGVERTLGAIVSVGMRLDPAARLSLSLHARAGALAAQSRGAIARDFGEVAMTGRWRATSWLTAEAEAVARSYSAVVGRQHWTVVRTGGEVRLPIGWAGAQGIMRLGYLPVVRVAGLEAPRLAFAAGAGMEYALGRVRVRGLYELERYDFPPVGAARRIEQLSTVSVALSLRLRRVP